MVLCYPVISFGAFAHAGSRQFLLGDNPDPQLVENLSNELQVTAQTPPTFLFHTTTDAHRAGGEQRDVLLRAAQGRRARGMHIYERGPHGVGLAQSDPVLASWPARLADWLRVHGWLTAK